MAEIYLNGMRSTLSADIDNSQTTIDINPATNWPTGTDTYRIMVCRGDKTNPEIMIVTDSSNYPTLTVGRGAEAYGASAVPVSHAQDELVIIVLTAAGLGALVPNVPTPTFEEVLLAGNNAGGNSVVGVAFNQFMTGPDGSVDRSLDASTSTMDASVAINNATENISLISYMYNIGSTIYMDRTFTAASGSFVQYANLTNNQNEGSIIHSLDIPLAGHIYHYGDIQNNNVAVSENVEAMGNRALYKDTYYIAHGGDINAPLTMQNEAFGDIDDSKSYTTVSGSIVISPVATSDGGSVYADIYLTANNPFESASFQPIVTSFHGFAYTGLFAVTQDGSAYGVINPSSNGVDGRAYAQLVATIANSPSGGEGETTVGVSEIGGASTSMIFTADSAGHRVEFREGAISAGDFTGEFGVTYKVSGTISSAEILQLNSSPKLILTTPANTLAIPTVMVTNCKFGTAPYTVATQKLDIGQPGSLGAILGVDISGWDSATEDFLFSTNGYSGACFSITAPVSQAGNNLYIYLENSDPTVGDGTIDYIVYFHLIQL